MAAPPPGGDRVLQELVSGLMTVDVVEGLEVVDIEDRHREPATVVARELAGPGQLVIPGSAVRGAGQGIGARQRRQLHGLGLHHGQQVDEAEQDQHRHHRRADRDHRPAHRAVEAVEDQHRRRQQQSDGHRDDPAPPEGATSAGGAGSATRAIAGRFAAIATRT